MPKADCCGKDLKNCTCGRSRTPDRREREAKDAAGNDKLLASIAKLLDDKLDEKLAPMNQKIDALLADLAEFKEKIRKELDAVGIRLSNMEDAAKAHTGKMQELETEMQKLKLAPKEASNSTRTICSALVGNIPGVADFEKAKSWIVEQCSRSNVPLPCEIYVKDKTAFKGIVFVKCACEKDREVFINCMQRCFLSGSSSTGAARPFAKPDLPIDERTVESTLFSIKKMLVNWGFHSSCIRIDVDKSSLSVAGTEIVKASVKDYQLHLQWCDGDWESWDALQTSADLSDVKKL